MPALYASEEEWQYRDMNALKYLALLGNAGYLIFFLNLFFEDGFADSEALLVVGMIVLLGLNIYLIYRLKQGEDFVSLWFRRKALEEQKKINDISKKEV